MSPPEAAPPEAADLTAPWDALVGAVRVRFGAGRLAELGELAQEVRANEKRRRVPNPTAVEGATLSSRRVLLVTDPGVAAAGHAALARESLRRAGFQVTLFDSVEENPTTEHVAAGREVAAEARTGLIVAVGGGSAMDCAKGINFLLTNGGAMEDYRGYGEATQILAPSLGVPTTAGTGSEAQSYALVSRAEDHVKMACGDPGARFRAVILDPDLLATAPRRVAALAGMDAVSHAVESHASTAANPVSRLYSRSAWGLLGRWLSAHLASLDGGEPNARAAAAMLWGAHLAGAAIEQSMLGAAHSLANPLTAHHGVPHGAAVALGLPGVVRFNSENPAADAAYRDLLGELAGPEENSRWDEGEAGEGEAAEDGAGERLASLLEDLRDEAGLPASLAAAGVPADADLEALAREAAEQWTAQFNPRAVDEEALLGIYRRLQGQKRRQQKKLE